MSVRFVPETVRRELESQNTQLDAQRENFQAVTEAIDRYREEGRLLGRAFQAHKDYFGEGHLPFITAFRNMMLSQRNANVYHISRLGGLRHDYYNQAQIESELNQLAWSIPAAQAMVVLLWPFHAAWQTILDTRRARQALLQEKQQQLATYMTATATIYNDAEAQLQNVRRLLTRIEMQRVCDTTGVVSLPTMGEVDHLMSVREMVETWINEDGTLNRNIMREVEWDDLNEGIRHIKGEDVLLELLAQMAVAEEFLEAWGFPSPPNDPMLLLQKLQNRIIMEAIHEINRDPRFSLEIWRNASLEERQMILQDYQNAIMSIFGISIVDEIFFFDPADPERPRSPIGNYSHFGNRGQNREPMTVGMNNWWLEPGNVTDERSHELFATIVHELRHAYQAFSIENPSDFIVSGSTLDAWRSNYPGLGGIYISSGRERADGSGTYTWNDYRNQPIEVDAFGIGDFTGWVKR